MARKNTVLLTFAGNSAPLEKALGNVGVGARTMAKEADKSAGGIRRLGDAGGATETRFLGLGAGISGVSTLMSGGLNAETAAMAIADLGDAVEHTIAPLLTQGKQLIANGAAAARSAAQHVASAASVVAGWVAMGVQSAINAARIAAAWLISLGPAALVVAAVAGVIAVLVALGVGFDDIGRFAKAAWDLILGAARAVWDWLSTNWPLVLGIITGPIGLAVLAVVKHWDTIRNGFTAVKDWIRDRVNDIVGFVTGIPARIASAASSIGSTIINGIATGIGSVGGFVSDIAGAVKSAINSALHLPFTIHGPGPLPDFTIPAFHQGGIVGGAPGTESLALLQAGERVIPAGRAGQVRDVHIHVSGSIHSSRDLVAIIRDELNRGGFRGLF